MEAVQIMEVVPYVRAIEPLAVSVERLMQFTLRKIQRMPNIIMKDQADKSWIKESAQVEGRVEESKSMSFLVGGCVTAAIIALLLNTSPVKAQDCNSVATFDDYSISAEMAEYLKLQGLTVADLENMSREELEELGAE